MATQFGIYQTGTLSIGAGATQAVGVGTLWIGTAGNVKPGDWLLVGGVITVIEAAPTDNTHITIPAWTGAAVPAGTEYKIYQVSPDRYAGGSYGNDISRIIAALNTQGFYIFVADDQTVPDPSLGEESQWALQASTGKLWLMSGGVWVYQGIFAAFVPKGNWSNVTQYRMMNVVTFDGSSYLALLDNINQQPTLFTSSWQLLARGVDDAFLTSINTILTNAQTAATNALASQTAAAASAASAAAIAAGVATLTANPNYGRISDVISASFNCGRIAA